MKTKNTLFFFALFAIATFSFVLIPWGNNARALYSLNSDGDLVPIDSPPPNCTSTSWAPDPSTVCSGTSFFQTSSNCGYGRTIMGTENCNVNSACTFDPASVTTLSNGLVSQWISLCGGPFAEHLTNKGLSDSLFSAEITLAHMITTLGLPITDFWNPISVNGNIFEQIKKQLQTDVCQLETNGDNISLIIAKYHLGGNPFHLVSNVCTWGDITPPTVTVTLLSQDLASYTVKLVPSDNVGVSDASYNIGSAASANTPATQHFQTAIQITVPKPGPVTLYWWAKDSSGNENTGHIVLEKTVIHRCYKWGNVGGTEVCVGGWDD
jgi:hypothetical protein